jgi:hypothetical protein
MAKRKILTDALPMIYCYTIPGYTPKVGRYYLAEPGSNIVEALRASTKKG